MTHPKKKQKGQKKPKKVIISGEGAVQAEENVDRDVDEHPYQKGHYLVVRYRDGSHRLAKVR